MEFRTCPTCQASVLEDDVAECPFCGASMSGKPGAKPKSPAQPAATKGKQAAASTSGSPAKAGIPAKPSATAKPGSPQKGAAASQSPPDTGEDAPGEDDDPFGVDTTQHTKAIPMARQATKSRTVLIKCPMCETDGYIAETDAGKQIRCGNANCMVPIFRAPKAATGVVGPVVAAGPGLSPMIKFGVPLTLIAFVGAGWFLISSNSDSNLVMPPIELGPIVPSGDPLEQPETPVTVPTVVEQKTTQQLAADILKRATTLADERKPNNRSFEYSRQLATEMLADGGQLPSSLVAFSQLEKGSRKIPYHQVEPLVEQGWQALALGQQPEAEKYAKQALAIINDPALPKSVRRTLDAEIATIALLARLSLAAEALERLNLHRDDSPRGRMAMLWAAAIQGNSFDFELETQHPWHIQAPCPVWIAVIETLVSRGDTTSAWQLCSQAPNVAAQEACMAAWAGRAVLVTGAGPVPAAVTKALEEVSSPSAKARMWAAIAAARTAQGDRPGTDQALLEANSALGTLGTPQPAPLPSMKQIFDSNGKPHAGLPDPAPARSNALATADVAFVLLSNGKADEGWTVLQTALEWCRVMAPSPVATQKLLDDCAASDATIKDQLRPIVRSGTSDFLAFNQYRKQCGNLHALAQARLDLQTGLLKTAVLRGQRKNVWEFIVTQSAKPELNSQEPYLQGERPVLLSLLLMEADTHDQPLAAEIRKSRAQPLKASTLDWLRATLPSQTQDVAGFPNAAVAIRREQHESADGKAAPFELDEILLCLFSRVQQQAPPKQYLELLELIDPTVDEDAFRLYGGWKGRTEAAAPVLEAMGTMRQLEVTQKLSVQRGLIDSLP